MDNIKAMEIYNSLSRPPKDALKQITGGKLSGKTDINPQWKSSSEEQFLILSEQVEDLFIQKMIFKLDCEGQVGNNRWLFPNTGLP